MADRTRTTLLPPLSSPEVQARETGFRREIAEEARAAGIEQLRVGDHGRLSLWHAPPPNREPAAAPILLLHGVTYSTLSVFDLPVAGRPRGEYSLLLRLAHEHGLDVYGLDFREYGCSDHHPPARGIDDLVNDTVDALRAIRQATRREPLLVGWSWGAQVGARTAATAPDLCGALAIWGSFWGGGLAPRPEALRGAVMDRATPGTRRLNTEEHAAADFMTRGTFDEELVDAFVARALEIDSTSPVTGRVEVGRNLPLYDASRLSMPVLLLHGEFDPMVSDEDLTLLQTTIPHRSVLRVVIDGSDHNVQFGLRRRDLDVALASFATQSRTGTPNRR